MACGISRTTCTISFRDSFIIEWTRTSKAPHSKLKPTSYQCQYQHLNNVFFLQAAIQIIDAFDVNSPLTCSVQNSIRQDLVLRLLPLLISVIIRRFGHSPEDIQDFINSVFS